MILPKSLGRPAEAGSVVGKISISARLIPIEVDNIVNGNVQSAVMPAINRPDNGTTPGPDVIVGDLPSVETSGGTVGSFVGLGVGTTSCNAGVVDSGLVSVAGQRSPGHSAKHVSDEWRCG